METACKSCGQKLKLSEALVGKQVRCPKCKTVMVVGGPAKASGKPAPTAPTAAQKPAASKPAATKPTSSKPAASKPAASASASQSNQQTPSRKAVKCPKCAVSIRLPSDSTATAFKCPKCATQIRLKAAPAAAKPSPKPAAPAASNVFDRDFSSSSPSSMGSDDPFAFTAAPAASAAMAAPTGFGSPAAARPTGGSPTSYAAPRSSAGKSGYPANRNISGPGMILIIQAVIAIGINIISLGLLVLVKNMESSVNEPGFQSEVPMGLWIGSAILSIIYQAVALAGGVAMIRRKSIIFGRVACVLAIVPISAATFGLCPAILFYPLALAGGIWGLVALWPAASGSQAASAGSFASSPAAMSPAQPVAGNPYQSPAVPAAAASFAPAANNPKSATPNVALGIAQMMGGAVALVLAAGLCYALYEKLNSDEGSRRTGRSVGGIIAISLFGFGLIGSGYRSISGTSE